MGIHKFSGKPVRPVSHHSHHNKYLSYIQSKSTLFQVKTVAPCPVTTDLGKKLLSSVCLIIHLYV